jgi:spermidine/putrescine transport system permease protein
MSSLEKEAIVSKRSLGASISRWFGKNLIRIYMALAFVYLFIPVAYTFVFSFNDSGKSNITWQGFTFEKLLNPCGAPRVCEAL